MTRVFTTLLLIGLVPAIAFTADKPATGFVDKTFKNADGTTSPYVVFVPHDYDGTKEYPVILSLHGSGETKGGGKKPAEVALGMAIKARAKTFPFITVFPQSEKRTWKADSEDGKRAMTELEEVMKAYKCDPARIYLTGLSMGGVGTWSFAAAYPDKWAAIVPLCGRGDLDNVDKIKHIPCWCFVGDEDSPRTVQNSRDMIAALKKGGSSPKFTEYPKVGHNCWDKAYATDELYTWLLEQKKK